VKKEAGGSFYSHARYFVAAQISSVQAHTAAAIQNNKLKQNGRFYSKEVLVQFNL